MKEYQLSVEVLEARIAPMGGLSPGGELWGGGGP
jgi:hypothetical protein